MNEFERIANEKFNGDLNSAVEYVMEKMSPEDQERITEDLTSKQALLFVDYFDKTVEEKGLEAEFDKNLDEEFNLAAINMSKEEVKNMPTNPFKAKLGKDLLKFLCLNAGVAALYLTSASLKNNSMDGIINAALAFSAFLTTCFSFDTVKDILNYFKFKKMKKQYDIENQNEIINGPGRSM